MKTLPRSDITHLEVKKSGSTGQGTSQVCHFKILAHYGNNQTLTIAEDIDGEDLAGHFKNYLAERLNLTEL